MLWVQKKNDSTLITRRPITSSVYAPLSTLSLSTPLSPMRVLFLSGFILKTLLCSEDSMQTIAFLMKYTTCAQKSRKVGPRSRSSENMVDASKKLQIINDIFLLLLVILRGSGHGRAC